MWEAAVCFNCKWSILECLCMSEENDSSYCSVDFSLTSTLQHWPQRFLFFSLSLCVQQRFPGACCLCFFPEEETHREKRAKQKFPALWEHRTIQCSRVWFSRSQRCYRNSDRWQASSLRLQKWPCRTLWPHNLWNAWDRPNRLAARAQTRAFGSMNSSAKKV